MSAHLPHLPLRGGRRVLIYQPSCQSCTSTVEESCAPTELDANSSDEEVAAAVASSSATSQLAGASSGGWDVLPPSGRREVGTFSNRLDVLSSSASSQLAGASGGQDVLPPSGHQEDHQQHDRDRSRSPARLPVLSVQGDEEEEGVGESGRADDYLEVAEEVEGVGEFARAADDLEVPGEVDTQLMNGSASIINVDVRGGDPWPLQVGALGRWGVGTSQQAPPGPQWMSASAAEATDAGSSAAGFLLARAFRNILAPPFSSLLTLTFDGGETISELARVGVGVSGRMINAIVDEGRSFYIGITENPVRRWHEHVHAPGTSWECMEVLVPAPSSAVTKPIEQDLIQQWGGHFLCTNVGAGGERASAGMPHYVYVLEGSALLRRSAR